MGDRHITAINRSDRYIAYNRRPKVSDNRVPKISSEIPLCVANAELTLYTLITLPLLWQFDLGLHCLLGVLYPKICIESLHIGHDARI